MTALLRMTGFFGLILFSFLLVFVVSVPEAFERNALSFVKSEVTREVMDRYPDLADRPVDDAVREGLGRLSDRIGLESDGLKRLAASDYPEIIGRIVEDFCTCGPADRERVELRSEAIRAALETRAVELGADQNRLVEFARSQYKETVGALRADLMIFLSVNAFAFAAVFAVSFVPRERRHALVVPAMLLVVATGISIAIYVFGTDWFYAIIFQDYAGWWYSIGLLFIFALLADIVANRARVTLNILSNLPSAITVPPC